EAPTAQEIDARFPDLQKRIVDAIEPIVNVDADGGTGVVTVQLMPVDPPGLASRGAGGGLLGPGAGGVAGGILGTGGDMLDRALLGVLAIISVGMMLMMVRKAGKRVTLPTAEEIVGLPPDMTTEEELIGEAGESEGALTALEVDDDDVQSQQMLEQVSMIVNQDAKSSAMLLQRWMDQEE
ncbi:MAG: hypothetical protein KDA28_11845, partial [Phycisphaerales bacterium]|nr:hypothetical protein [Phycisphaerales bacterium]